MYVTFSISVFNCGLSIFNKRILLLLSLHVSLFLYLADTFIQVSVSTSIRCSHATNTTFF